jgi:hypothetical protein
MTTFRADIRTAAATMLDDYAATANLKLQVYPGRPRTLYPPTGFVDRISERITFDGIRQRLVSVEVVVIHGLFDSKDAVEQADVFVDGWVDWTTAQYHAAGANTILEPRGVEDDPNYVPDWLPPTEQKSYYATVITLEGFAGG